MIIFLSSSTFSIAQQLRGAIAIGCLGMCRGHDTRAVMLAAALSDVNVIVVNTLLFRTAIASIATAILTRLCSHLFPPMSRIASILILVGCAATAAYLILEYFDASKLVDKNDA